jgi:Uma2 family endonuclease
MAHMVPRLIDGERLSRAVFEERFDAHPDQKVAELLEGVVRLTNDGRFFPATCRADLTALFGSYAAVTPHVLVGAHSSLLLDDENELQPDHSVLIRRENGGRGVLDSAGCLRSAPELAAYVVSPEFAELTAKRKRVLHRFGASELVFWYVNVGTLEWFVRRANGYDRLPPDADGLLKSVTFPGLWLDPAALVRRDLPAVLAALTRGLATPEHAAFVERLRAATRPPA